MEISAVDLMGTNQADYSEALDAFVTSGVRSYDKQIVTDNAMPVILGLLALAFILAR